MFQQVVNDLQARVFGKKIKDANGQLVDTGVDELAQALSEALLKVTQGPIYVSQPLVIINQGTGPAIDIQQAGGSAAAITMATPDGPSSSVGVGLGNQGLVANEFIPDYKYAIPQESIQQKYTTQGNNGGEVEPVPGQGYIPSQTINQGVLAGSGPLPNNVPTGVLSSTSQPGAGAVGHGYHSFPSALPVLKRTTNTGAGAGAGAPRTLPVLKGGGGTTAVTGSTIHRGQNLGTPTVGFASMAEFFGNLRLVNGQIVGRINNMPVIFGSTGGGLSTGLNVVTEVSCNAGSLSVTTASLEFQNGLLTGVA